MRLTLALALLGLAAPLVAQQPAKPAHPPAAAGHDHAMALPGGGVFPPGWSVRTDEGPATMVQFQPMEPGFHLTMGTAAILYRNENTATPPAHIISTIHYFPKKGSGHHEGFGIFTGGQDLQGPNQKYTYFLVRGDGTFKIKRRDGEKTSDVVSKEWTPNAAIPKADPDKPSTEYTVAVTLGKDSVTFNVNGKDVWSGAAKDIDTNGIAGIRVNHNLSVHVQSFAIHKTGG
ncbi:MAG: hypothetical protein ABJD11_00035 [Gemmatimonadota bacterium]